LETKRIFQNETLTQLREQLRDMSASIRVIIG